jgi:gamma-butyrobetaine dioxygenase
MTTDPYRTVRLDLADVRAASTAPYELAEALLGMPPLMVERQPIKPLPNARSIASSREASPLHTDSQMLFGVPAAVQILVCVKPAERGGESTLVDGDAVIERLERENEGLARAAFDVDRVQRFYFGEVRGPTVAMRGGHLAWTLAPRAEPDDEIGKGLVRAVTSHDRIEIPLAANEALIASNHRMLHGRRSFEGDRELVRLLVWLEQPVFSARVHPLRAKIAAPAIEVDAAKRMRAVFSLIRGIPPAKIARDFGVDEPTLYAWREAMIRP